MPLQKGNLQMHPFRKIGILLLPAIVFVGGCQPLKAQQSSDTAPPPSATRVGSVLPSSTLNMLADKLHAPTLRNLQMTVQAEFKQNGNFTVAVTQDGKQIVSSKQIESAAEEIARLSGDMYKMRLVYKGKLLDITAQAKTRLAQEHLLTYVANAKDFRTLHRQIASNESVIPFTFYGTAGYSSSFIPDVPLGNTTIGRPIPQGITGTYVELCQNLIQLDVQSVNASQRTTSPWKQVPDGYIQLGAQETVCNSVGVAMAVSRAGMPYKVYKTAVQQRANQTRPTAVGVEVPLLLIDESAYSTFVE